MRRRVLYICLILLVFFVGIGLWRASAARANPAVSVSYLKNWSPQAAADYLDRREVWWESWQSAKIDHGTICVSCHTVVPYAMMRSALSHELHESTMPPPEKVLMGSVEKRVDGWAEMVPFYTDAAYGPGKTAQSHATESVLNAVILGSYDARLGHLRPITRTAFDEAWALQEQTGEDAGGWKWEDFRLAPFECAESGYQGAAMLMIAVENAPDGYPSEPQIQAHLELLRQYLRRQYAAQPLVNQLYVLWLSRTVPTVLTAAERTALLEAVQRRQRPDGGWSLSSLDPRSRLENVRWRRLGQRVKEQILDMVNPDESDGYATALVVLTLEESGSNLQGETAKRGLEWLQRHQASDGSWLTRSINGEIDPQTNIGRFMSDAATAYAVMALESKNG